MTKNIPDDQPRRTQGRRARPTVRSPRSDLAPRDPRLLPEDLLRRHPQAPGPSDEAFYEVLRQLHDFKPSVHWQRVFRVIRALIAEFAPPPPPKRRPCWADVAAASLPLCLLAALQSYRWYGQPFPLIIPQLMRLSGFDNPRPERPIQSDSLEQAFRRTVIENGLELFFPVVLIPDLQVDGASAASSSAPGTAISSTGSRLGKPYRSLSPCSEKVRLARMWPHPSFFVSAPGAAGRRPSSKQPPRPSGQPSSWRGKLLPNGPPTVPRKTLSRSLRASTPGRSDGRAPSRGSARPRLLQSSAGQPG